MEQREKDFAVTCHRFAEQLYNNLQRFLGMTCHLRGVFRLVKATCLCNIGTSLYACFEKTKNNYLCPGSKH